VEGVTSVRALPKFENDQTRIYIFYTGLPSETSFIAGLQRKLPPYMMPHFCMHCPVLPLTENGKVNDARLLEEAAMLTPKTALPCNWTNEEEKMALIWERLLGRKPASPADDFFELGGDSLLAMQLIQLVEENFGKKITLRNIFSNASLNMMVAAVDTEATNRLSIELNKPALSGNKMYLVPPVTGSSTIYTSLAGALSGTFHCIGLQYPGFDGNGHFALSIQAMAQSFFEEIVPGKNNRVYLLGYSFGALAAFETAKLLEQAGVEVHLALLDRGVVQHKRKPPGPGGVNNWAAQVEKEISEWFGASALYNREHMRKLIIQNLQNLLAYKQTGCIKGNILAIESGEGAGAMKGWKKYTGGNFISVTRTGEHYALLADPQLPACLREFANHEPVSFFSK
jgi:acyl carrier protein